jgi:hypothetical protein
LQFGQALRRVLIVAIVMPPVLDQFAGNPPALPERKPEMGISSDIHGHAEGCTLPTRQFMPRQLRPSPEMQGAEFFL